MVKYGHLHLNLGMNQKLSIFTHIMALVSIGVSVHKYSKSSEVIHVTKHRTCSYLRRSQI